MRALFILLLFQIIALTTNGQRIKNCKYPVYVSADLLVNTVVQDYIKRYGPTHITDSIWKRYHYDSTNGIKLDKAYAKCQKHLIKKLGKNIYCKYITMELMSFGKSDDRLGPYRLSFILELPGLKKEHRAGYSTFHYETVGISYSIQFENEKSFKITYPKNLPDCNGTVDCGFVITEEKAIAIAKEIKFLNETDKYYITVDGIDWIIKTADDVHGKSKSFKINLKTGKPSEFMEYMRID